MTTVLYSTVTGTFCPLSPKERLMLKRQGLLLVVNVKCCPGQWLESSTWTFFFFLYRLFMYTVHGSFSDVTPRRRTFSQVPWRIQRTPFCTIKWLRRKQKEQYCVAVQILHERTWIKKKKCRRQEYWHVQYILDRGHCTWLFSILHYIIPKSPPPPKKRSTHSTS